MQKFSQKITLAYSQDNQDLALELEGALNVTADFHHISCCRDKNNSIASSLQNFQGPIILLISDNFLRTAQCMEDGLAMLNEHGENILPVVIPGYRMNEDGNKEYVSTDFSKFKQVVQYINFWQDRYLDLRKQKRNDPDLNTLGFTDYLHTIRGIAGAAGQYLRTLQTLSPQTWEDFSANDFELFFEFLEDETLWTSFKSILTAEEITHSEQSAQEHVITPELTLITSGEVVVEAENKMDSIELNSLNEEVEVESIIAAAWQLEEKGEQEIAIAQLKVGIDRYSENTSLRYSLAVLFTQKGNYKEAKHEVDKLLGLTSKHEEVLFLAGELASIQGDTTLAIEYFQKLASTNDNYPEIYYVLAKLSQKQENSSAKEIEAFYKKACKKNTKNSSANYQLALLYLNGLNSPEKAEKHLKKTVKMDTSHPFAHYDLAVLFHSDGLYKKANKHYLKSILLEPSLQTTENDFAFSLNRKPPDNSKEDKIQGIKDKIKRLEVELKNLNK